jgi:hypothetical protein
MQIEPRENLQIRDAEKFTNQRCGKTYELEMWKKSSKESREKTHKRMQHRGRAALQRRVGNHR